MLVFVLVVVLVSGCGSTVDTWGGFDRRPISVENPPGWAEKLNKANKPYRQKKHLKGLQLRWKRIRLYGNRKWLETKF